MAEDIKKVAWNASQGLIMEISNRRSYANSFFVNGDIKKAINTLISIKQSVIQSLDNEERNNLKEKELLFSRASVYLNSSCGTSWNKDIRDAYVLSKRLSEKIYSEYNDLLMDLLEKYGYLIGEQTDSSKMKF